MTFQDNVGGKLSEKLIDKIRNSVLHGAKHDIENDIIIGITDSESRFDSDIEKLMYAAFKNAEHKMTGNIRWSVENSPGFSQGDGTTTHDMRNIQESLLEYAELEGGTFISVLPQMRIIDYRVDFLLIMTCVFNGGMHKFEKLVVECDGHEFHEKTKEQAARDKKRDRELLAAGYPTMRFTGRDIWSDATKCVEAVYEYFRKRGAIKVWKTGQISDDM